MPRSLCLALAMLAPSLGHAQVSCGLPGVVAEAIPPIAAPGQPIEIKLTNNSADPITIHGGCTYGQVHAGPDCSGPELYGVACAPNPIDIDPGSSASSYWDQRDSAGQQVADGEYSLHVTYFDPIRFTFPECCVPVTIDSPLATYCTAKPSFIGCAAAISTTNPNGSPVSGLGDYGVTATGVEELRNGLLFGGPGGPASLPFEGGTLCVQPPLRRGPILNSGGQTPIGCTGSFATVVNDGVPFPFGLDAGPGNSAWYQYWHRVRGGIDIGLSNAVRLDFQ